MGINYYTSALVSPLPDSEMLQWPDDGGFEYSSDPSWRTAQSDWLKVSIRFDDKYIFLIMYVIYIFSVFHELLLNLKVIPEGLGDFLRTIKRKYNNPDVYILENGVSDGNGTDDYFRIDYIHSHLKQMLIAINRDKCNVKAYTYWSFLDSFEWNYGYQ